MADNNRAETAIASGNPPSAVALPAVSGQGGMAGTQHRSKMSEEYDEALAQNIVTSDGREGERLNQGENNAVPSPDAPGQASASPAENALSTQSESKMAIGEELRDREFPVPPQKSGATSQRLVVDQETMRDEGPRSGGGVGTMPGDHQNVGQAPNIMDQRAETPDLLQQH